MQPTSFVIRSLVTVALLFAAACGDDDGDGDITVADVTENPGLDYGPLGDVVTDGDRFLGQEVTVNGEVTARVDDRVFHIAGEDGSAGLLIVSDQPVVEELDSDDIVEVVGTVREVEPSTFEVEFGVPYDEDYDSFGGRHAIFASSVRVVGEAEDEIDGPVDDDRGEGIAEEGP